MSKHGQLMVLRGIGVAITLEGTMLPTMELLLRHAIQYFGLKGSAMLRDPDSALDSSDRFLEDLPSLPEDERSVVLCVHLLCEMFDGDLDRAEFRLWQKIHYQLHPEAGPIDEGALQAVARDFRNRKYVTAATLRKAIEPGAKVPKRSEIFHNLTQFLLQ